MLKPKAPKPRKCQYCKQPTTNRYGMTTACNPECAIEALKARRIKKERKALREDRERIKTRPELRKEASKAFRDYIRERDRGQPCICCGSYGEGQEWLTGGKWDAGHFLSVGSHPELEFEPLNCHLQLKTCNSGSGKYGKFHGKERTVSARYEMALILKIGVEAVDWLKGPHEPKKYTADDFREIKAHYNKLRRNLEMERL